MYGFDEETMERLEAAIVAEATENAAFSGVRQTLRLGGWIYEIEPDMTFIARPVDPDEDFDPPLLG